MRDHEKEIDELWEELAGLWAAINAQNIEQRHEQAREAGREPYTEERECVRIMHNMHPGKRLSEMMEELCETADAEGLSGRIIYNVIL